MIPDPQIFFPKVITVMEADLADDRSRQQHRFQNTQRCEHTGPTQGDFNIFQHRFFLFRRKFISHGEPRRFGGVSHKIAITEIIQFKNETVRIVAEIFALRGFALQKSGHIIHIRKKLKVPIDKKSLFLQKVESIFLCLRQFSFAVDDIVSENGKIPFGRDFRIQLTERPCRRVSGIGKKRFPGFFSFAVQRGEFLFGKISLTANDQSSAERNGQRYRLYGFQIFGNIFADLSVAPGRAADKEAAFIFQCNGKTVDLPFHNIIGMFHAVFDQTLMKILQFPGGECIGERKQRQRMLHGFKSLHGTAAHTQSGAVRPLIFGILRFQRFQFLHGAVVNRVGHNGTILLIISAVPLIQFFGKLFNALFHFTVSPDWHRPVKTL